jgi:hypothetical protein
MSIKGIYEAWKLPGGKEVEGRIGAKEAKSIGARIFVCNSWQQFTIHHRDNWGDDRFSWKMHENQPVGSTRGAVDNWVEIDSFPSLREARAEVLKRVRAGVYR